MIHRHNGIEPAVVSLVKECVGRPRAANVDLLARGASNCGRDDPTLFVAEQNGLGNPLVMKPSPTRTDGSVSGSEIVDL